MMPSASASSATKKRGALAALGIIRLIQRQLQQRTANELDPSADSLCGVQRMAHPPTPSRIWVAVFRRRATIYGEVTAMILHGNAI